MCILLISPLPPPAGGIATWTTQYMEYCRKVGAEVLPVNTTVGSGRDGKRGVKGIFDELTRTIHILHQMRKRLCEHPDVVHLNTSCGTLGIFRDLLCAEMASRKNIPVVSHFHCDVKNYVTGRAQKKALKKMLSLSEKAFALNSVSCQMLAEYSNPQKVRIVPNFISTDKLSDGHEIRDRVKEIVYVGHIRIEKGIGELLQAAKSLSELHFTLVGPVYWDIPAELMSANVTLTGPKTHEQVKEYLQNADVFLFPSYSEGFSMALTEAMAEGLPAIASDVGANRDMLSDRGGVIIPVKNVQAIVDAFDKISPSDVRQRMSDWNRSRVKEEYLTDRVMKIFFQSYQEIIERSTVTKKQENAENDDDAEKSDSKAAL